MSDPEELAQLIQRLSRVSSPLERLRMLARGWRSLRRLSPRQRQDLATRIGVADGADLIERLAARKGGLNPGMVQRALDRVRSSDPSEIRSAIRGLRDPDQRKELLSRGLDAASGVLAPLEVEEEPGEPAGEAPVVHPPAVEPVAAPIPVTTAPPQIPAVAAPAPTPPPASAAPDQASPRPPRSTRRPADPPLAVPAVTAAAAARPAPKTEPKRADAPRPAQPGPETGRLLERIQDEPLLIRKFRTLRRHVDEARGLNARQLRDLVEQFPPGWGRRRALDALLENAIPDSLNKAIFLIEQLESDVERRWCVSTLLHEWNLTGEQQELLAERHRMFRGGLSARL